MDRFGLYEIEIMCLYRPTKGEIRLNGKNIWDYDFKEYTNLMAVVFQDYKILAFTIKENLIFSDDKNASAESITEALKQGGLYDKIQKLPYKEETYISRQFEEKGVELSGGEQQKLAISHAIYKNSPILILDEPTANLSPMAEYEVFNQFNQIAREKTAIYISHRMSSCRFSDKIIVFKNGEIIELGTHSTLMKEEGEYANMFQLQAEFYHI